MNLKNWHPEMSLEEHLWFDKCPKAVLFEIARQFGMRIGGDFTSEGGFAAVKIEWAILHLNGIVPQRPFDSASAAEAAQRHLNVRAGTAS